MIVRVYGWVVAVVATGVACYDVSAQKTTSPAAAVSPGVLMDYGPFLTGSLDLDPAVSAKQSGSSTEQTGDNPNTLAAKAVNVRLRAGDVEAAVAFDTDLLRYAAGWTGGFVKLDKTHLATEKGNVPLSPAGRLAFTTPLRTPGWSTSADRSFKDPRSKPFGPLPKGVGRYQGLYRHGDRVVFRYTIGGVDVLDTPGLIAHPGGVGFTRTLRIGPGAEPLSLLVCETKSATALVEETPVVKTAVRDGSAFVDIGGNRTDAVVLHVTIVPQGQPIPARDVIVAREAVDFAQLTAGGPALWKGRVETTEQRATTRGKPYVVDELSLPTENPWNAWLRPTGFDFFKDGSRAALCTWNGDVWVISGVGDPSGKLKWKRFAAGLYEPLGLRIVDDVIYATCRDQIVRLRDLNGDGEADFYECFNNDGVVSANYHGFAMELQTDAARELLLRPLRSEDEPRTAGSGVTHPRKRRRIKIGRRRGGASRGERVGHRPERRDHRRRQPGNWMPARAGSTS